MSNILNLLTFFALQQRVSAVSEEVKPNQKLYEHLLEMSSDNGSLDELMMFNPTDLFLRVMIENNLIDGTIGNTAPVNPNLGSVWLKRATLGTAPMIATPAELKQFDGTNWVTPNYELTYKAIAQKVSEWDSSCTFDHRPTFVNYHDTAEGYLVGQWVVKNGIYSMSKTGTPSSLNYVDPDLANITVRETNWRYRLTEAEFCEETAKALHSLVSALFDLVGKDEVDSSIVVNDIKKAIADMIMSGIKTWAMGDSNNNGNSIVKGSDGKLYLSNPAGNPAGNDPVAAGSVPTHWYGAFDSLAKLLAFSIANDPSKAGLKTWAIGDSGANGNPIVFGSDGRLYIANPNGDPANNNPVIAASRPTHWQGGFVSIGDLLAAIAGAGAVPNGWTIVDANCDTGMIKLKKPDGTTCTLFTKELEGVGITAPTSASAGQNGLSASVTTPSNGTAPYTYHWTLPDGSTADTQSVTFTAPTTAGTYTIKCDVTDANGMTTSKSQSITINDLPKDLAVVSGCSPSVTLTSNPFKYKKVYVKVRSHLCCSAQVADTSEWIFNVEELTLDHFGQAQGVDTWGERVILTKDKAAINEPTRVKWTWMANWGESSGRNYSRQFDITENSVTVSNSVEGISDCILSVRGEV